MSFSPGTVARHPDIVVMVVAFPIFIIAELPLIAYFVVSALWIAQAYAGTLIDRRIAVATEPRQMVGLTMGGAMARAWFTATGAFVLGLLTDDSTGLAALVYLAALFTAYFIHKVLSRSFSGVAGEATR